MLSFSVEIETDDQKHMQTENPVLVEVDRQLFGVIVGHTPFPTFPKPWLAHKSSAGQKLYESKKEVVPAAVAYQ